VGDKKIIKWLKAYIFSKIRLLAHAEARVDGLVFSNIQTQNVCV
jgi:hypothetical protein